MALKETIKHLRDLLNNITHDLQKAEGGNKAASQRVRTGTVKLEKVAKHYRKESIKGEKSAPKAARKPAKKAAHKKAPTAKKAHVAKKTAKHATAKKATIKSKPKAKAHRAHPRAMSFKRPSAKLPARR